MIPPELASRYEVLGILGQGGMGRVLDCVDRELGRRVALKITGEAGDDPETRRRADREARLLAAITSPGVVKILDAGVAGDLRYIVMERLEGRSLASRLERGACLDQKEMLDILRSLLATLAEVHAAGILHRDIKPGNVLLPEGRSPVLVDFGIARRLEASTRLTRPGQRIGSLRYLAPEVLSSGTYSPRSDLYSLAITAFTCLHDLDLHTGACRDAPLTAPALVSSVASGTYITLAQRALAGAGVMGDSLLRAMARHPEDRPAGAREWLSALPAARGRSA